MSSYKPSYNKTDLYELLSNYEKRIQKKVEQIASKVINLSNIEGLYRNQPSRYASINPQKERHTRSISMVDTNTKNNTLISKNKILANIEEKLAEGNFLPRIRAEKAKQREKQRLDRSKNKYTKPKFIARRPTILPKQIRNNPFSQPRPVPVSELKHGLLNLMNKGIINRDVDISVAFEWGQAPFQSKGAVMHSYDEVVIHEEEEQKKLPKYERKEDQMPSFPSSIKNPSPGVHEKQGWALTGLDSSVITIKRNPERKQPKGLALEVIHIEFKNFVMRTDTREFKQFKKRNITIWGEINQTLKSIQKYVQKYSIHLAFADGKKVAIYSLNLYKLTENQINECIVGSISQRKKLQKFKRIANGPAKEKLAAQIICKLLKANVSRTQYKKTQNIKNSKLMIANWIYNTLQRRKTRAKIAQNNQLRDARIKTIQSDYQTNYQSIVSSKHYQIHIPSHLSGNLVEFQQKLNTQITRIFHLGSNVNIIYVSPIPMSEETINYYYKIMELGEVQNFKERVKFINCVKSTYFDAESLNKRLYYSSKSLRQVKKIIKGSKAVIIGGEAEEAGWYLVDTLQVPSASNFRQYELMKRSSPLGLFRTLDVPYLPFWKVEPTPIGEFYLNELARKLTNFASDNKFKTICVRVNSEPSSLVTVRCPVQNYEDLLERTTLYNSDKYPSPNVFFRQILTVGGVAQRHDQFRYLRSLVYIAPDQTTNMLGTFEKILTPDYTLVGICFTQQVVDNRVLNDVLNPLIDELVRGIQFYGYVEIDLVFDKMGLLLQGIHWGLSEIGSSFFYFGYLSNAKQTFQGLYQSRVIEPETLTTLNQYRYYVYTPFVLHFGLNQSQLKNFFQLCRAEGISFDLQKKYGSAFALLQGVKNAVGILATAKSTKIALGLIIQAISFIYRQTCRNGTDDREVRMRNRNNILAVKSRLEECYNRGMYD